MLYALLALTLIISLATYGRVKRVHGSLDRLDGALDRLEGEVAKFEALAARTVALSASSVPVTINLDPAIPADEAASRAVREMEWRAL